MKSSVLFLLLVSSVSPLWAGSTVPEKPKNWAFEMGMAVLTEDDLGEIVTGHISTDRTTAGGEVYQITATRTIDSFPLYFGKNEIQTQLELPLCLEYVSQNDGDDFFTYNFALQVRVLTFPWNDIVKTSFAVGGGLSYSEQVYSNDRRFHEGKERSHIKFNLPVQLTFALPQRPDQELMLYLAHHSGGFGTFDVGGVNSVGMGVRWKF